MNMAVVCVAASVGAVVFFLCGLPWNGESRVFLTGSHSSYPWNGTGETGLKSGRTRDCVLESS